jgi:tetratricopeptide (TPR) repeat protein/curved DNA-binding protein CbpA
MTGKNLYELLGVHRGATQKEIRKSYMLKVKQSHPDRFNQESQKAEWNQANELLKELNLAYEVLRDPIARAHYDHPISRRPTRPSRPGPGTATAPPNPPKKQPPKPHPKAPSQRRTAPVNRSKTKPNFDRIKSGVATFESLPRSSQQRLVARVSGKNQTQYSIQLADITAATFWVLLLSLWFLFLFTAAAAPLWESTRITALTCLTTIIAGIQAVFFHQVVRWHQSPLRSWFFVTPLYLIRTHMNQVWYWPLWELSDIKATPNYHKGKYQNTTVRLRFNGQYESFRVSQHLACELLLSSVQNFEQRFRRAKLHEDWVYFWEHDDFREVATYPVRPPRIQSRYGAAVVSLVFCTMAFASAYTWNTHRDEELSSAESPRTAHPEDYAPRRFTTSYFLETPTTPLADTPVPAPAPARSVPTAQTLPPTEKESSTDWKALNEESALFYERGQYERALEATNKALEIARKSVGKNHPNYATSLSRLALICDFRGQHEEAKSLYAESLAIREKTLGAHHPDVATNLNNLALLNAKDSQYGLAEAHQKRALVIWEKTLGPDHLNVATGLNGLGEIYRTQGMFSQAEPLYLQSLKIRERILGPKNSDVAGSLNNLAELYRAQGKYQQALPLYERALEIWEDTLGREHPDIAGVLNNLALLYANQHQFTQAEHLHKRALSIQENTLGLEHPDITGSLNNLANLYHMEGAYDRAEPLLKRSLAIREKAFGSRHPDVATGLNNLAALYHAEGLYPQAEQLYSRSLTILEKALGQEHPTVAQCLNNLGLLYTTQARYEKAEPQFDRARAIQETALGPNHVDVAATLDNLAMLYRATNRRKEARDLEKKSASIRALGR